MKKSILFFLCFLFLVPGILKAADFDFYGIKFGMLKEEVGKIFLIYGHEVINPGHYMFTLYLDFDHKNRLFSIEAYYPTEPNEKTVALFLALKEKFEARIKQFHNDIEITIDTDKHRDRKCIVMKLTSKTLQNEYIQNLKANYLESMK